MRESQLVAGFAHAGGQGFGINWIVKNEPRLGYVVFHNGGTEGYHASLWMLPERGVGVIALGPATDALDAIAHRALEIIVDQSAPAAPPPMALGGPARAALARVRALLVAPERAVVEQAFTPEFLASIPADQVVKLFEAAKANAGACSGQRIVKAASPGSVELELICERATLRITLEANAAPPHLVRSLTIEPR